MNDDREAILGRIREGLKRSVLPQAQPTLKARTPATDEIGRIALVESFSREVQAVGGEVYAPATIGNVAPQILQLVRDMGASEILAWKDAELPVAGLGDRLRAEGLTLSEVALARDVDGRRAQMHELDKPLVGLTGALAGLADTGSVALLSGAGRARAASLLPLLHIALLQVSQIFPTMAAFLAQAGDLTTKSSNLVFVTGPSRTADIEMVITRGVHGPKRLAVVLVPEKERPSEDAGRI